ncbi:MAG: hypothetical protein JWN62_272 [Acidimicrobiales bacterium]|nr:hypothetical protein [Acidimicrobiales bacterium]
MNTCQRLSVFGIVLAGIFGIGIGAGAMLGPPASAKEVMAPAPMGEGVVSTKDGYRFVPATGQLDAAGGTFHFVIEGPRGAPVLDFTPEHEKDLHFILVNRDLTVFHHLHPTRAANGRWSIDLPALPPGSYRAVADFHVAHGPHLALGTDLSVAGDYIPTALAEPDTTSRVDGYEITMQTDAREGGEVKIALIVSKDGHVITDLQPYLGAFGHLVAMHSGDLVYAHVHPDDYLDGTVHFDAELSSEGRYGLFFDFKHGDIVHTATFTFDQGLVTGAPMMNDH